MAKELRNYPIQGKDGSMPQWDASVTISTGMVPIFQSDGTIGWTATVAGASGGGTTPSDWLSQGITALTAMGFPFATQIMLGGIAGWSMTISSLAPVRTAGLTVPGQFALAGGTVTSAAATAGANYATSGTDNSAVGTVAWTNPNFITADDGSFASAPLSTGVQSHYLVGSGYNFSVPGNATITGLLFEMKARYAIAGPGISDTVVQLSGAFGTSSNKAAGAWGSSFQYRSYGGPGDLWGLSPQSLTPAAVNSPSFAVQMSASGTGGGATAQVDAFRVTVYYKTPQSVSLLSQTGDVKFTLSLPAPMILADGSQPFTASQSMGGFNLTNVADPSGAQDAATKRYVDEAVAQLAAKNDVQAATIAALPASTYDNGAAGIGATLTGNVAAVLVLDGYTPALNDRLLIKNQASATENGLYALTTVGVLGVTQWVLTRTADFDEPIDGINGALVYVLKGTTNGNTLWSCVTDANITFGSTNINWFQFQGTTYTADETTLHLAGTTFSIISTYVGQTSITTLGTISTGTWQGSVVGVQWGGTGQSSLTAHAILVGNGTGSVGFIVPATAGRVLLDQGAGADPAFTVVSGDATLNASGVMTNTGLQGMPVLPGAISGQILIDNSGTWTPTTVGGDATLGATGTMTNTGLQGRPVSNTPPTSGQVLGWNGTAWVPIAATNIAPGDWVNFGIQALTAFGFPFAQQILVGGLVGWQQVIQSLQSPFPAFPGPSLDPIEILRMAAFGWKLGEVLQVKLASAKTTTDCTVEADCVDLYNAAVGSVAAGAVAGIPDAGRVSTNGTTAVQVLGAPQANIKRVLTDFVLPNLDSVVTTVTIQILDANENAWRVGPGATLQPGETFCYHNGSWYTIDTSGNKK